jgi:hypothetical protein
MLSTIAHSYEALTRLTFQVPSMSFLVERFARTSVHFPNDTSSSTFFEGYVWLSVPNGSACPQQFTVFIRIYELYLSIATNSAALSEPIPPSREETKPITFVYHYTITLCASYWQCQLTILSSFLIRKSGQRPNGCSHESSHVCTMSIIRSENGLLICSHSPLELAQSVIIQNSIYYRYDCLATIDYLWQKQ